MKFLGWILFLAFSSKVYSQNTVIEPAPLSVEDDGTRKILNKKKGEPGVTENILNVISPPQAEALMTPNDDVINPPLAEQSEQIKNVNPIDGQLNLDESGRTSVLVIPSEDNLVTPTHNSINEDVLSEYDQRILRNYLQYSFGYLDSQYKKIHPSLVNGSTMTSFKFVADVSSRYQLGFAVEILSDKSAQSLPDNIRVLQYRLFFDYHRPLYNRGALNINWIGGFGISVGDFSIRRYYNNTLGQVSTVKIKDGMIVGFIPTAGLRFYLFDKNSFDIMFEYHKYLITPQRHIGGLAIAPRFSFLF